MGRSNLPSQGMIVNQGNMMASGIIQHIIEIMFIVRDRCCEKNIDDLCVGGWMREEGGGCGGGGGGGDDDADRWRCWKDKGK